MIALMSFAAFADVAGADVRSEVAALLAAGEVGYVVDERDRVLVDVNGQQPFIPASILKTFTTLLAAEQLGLDARFTTEFFVDGDFLVVRGRGDPFLVSEELDLAVAALAPRLAGRGLAGVAIDDAYFSTPIVIPGVGSSDNPYDAPNTATAVNFNTINVRWQNGEIVSAEPQTPLTPLAAVLARRRRAGGELRINLGNQNGEASRYAGEVIAAKLRQAGIAVGDVVKQAKAPTGGPLYVHRNSRNLAGVCRGLLLHSNNFIANQVFLALGAAATGAPASLPKSVGVADRFLAAHPELRGLSVTEGSGISYDNRVTAYAMAALLKRFLPYRSLLPEKDGVAYKTGTLKITRTLAGYFDTAAHGTIRFVIRLDGARSDRRWRIVNTLRDHL